MKNKVLIELCVPDIDKKYDVFIPVNKKIGNIIVLLSKAINEESKGLFVYNNQTALYSSLTGEIYPVNEIVRKTDIRNGSRLVLM